MINGIVKAKKQALLKFIESKQEQQKLDRLAFSRDLMKNYVGLYKCKECIHGLTTSCQDNLANGCEYFFNALTNRSFCI